jgi:hypothetical protein
MMKITGRDVGQHLKSGEAEVPILRVEILEVTREAAVPSINWTPEARIVGTAMRRTPTSYRSLAPVSHTKELNNTITSRSLGRIQLIVL